MFKEALAGVLILSLFYGIYRFLRRKRIKAAAVLAGVLLLFSIFANIIYNSIVMFPDFYMDTVTGPYRYGTFLKIFSPTRMNSCFRIIFYFLS